MRILNGTVSAREEVHFKKVHQLVSVILEASLIRGQTDEHTHVAFLKLVHGDVPPPQAYILLVNY